MPAAAPTPRVRLMAVCDGVRGSNTEAGVFHLRGVRQGCVADDFPFIPSRLLLFFLLSSPRPGEYPGYVLVINDRTEKAVFTGNWNRSPCLKPTTISWLATSGSGAAFRSQADTPSRSGFFKSREAMC
jgi:hypothetical protein